jgi:hypothetical protein
MQNYVQNRNRAFSAPKKSRPSFVVELGQEFVKLKLRNRHTNTAVIL